MDRAKVEHSLRTSRLFSQLCNIVSCIVKKSKESTLAIHTSRVDPIQPHADRVWTHSPPTHPNKVCQTSSFSPILIFMMRFRRKSGLFLDLTVETCVSFVKKATKSMESIVLSHTHAPNTHPLRPWEKTTRNKVLDDRRH